MHRRFIVVLWPVSLLLAGWVGSVLPTRTLSGASPPAAPTAAVRDEESSAPHLSGRPPTVRDAGVPPAGALVHDEADSEAEDVPPGVRAGDEVALQTIAELRELILRREPWAVLRRIGTTETRTEWLFEADNMRERVLRTLWLEHLLTHRSEVVDFLEDLLRTIAYDPENLPDAEDGVSLDAIQAFDDVLLALPFFVSDARLQRFRALLERITSLQEDGPEQLADWDAGGCIVVWAGFLDPESAVERLRMDGLDPREYAVLLGRLSDDQRSRLDPFPLLLRMVEADASWKDFKDALELLPPIEGDTAPLDAAVIEEGYTDPETLAWYLIASGRGVWPAGQDFVERFLKWAPRSRHSIIWALNRIERPPPTSYVEALLDTYDLGDGQEAFIREHFGIR